MNSPLVSNDNPQIIEKIKIFLFEVLVVVKKKYLKKSNDKKIWSVIDEVCVTALILSGRNEIIKELIIEVLIEKNCSLIL